MAKFSLEVDFEGNHGHAAYRAIIGKALDEGPSGGSLHRAEGGQHQDARGWCSRSGEDR
jgi:hypothetical protein